MARKGIATVKTPSKDDKYILVDSDSDKVSPPDEFDEPQPVFQDSSPSEKRVLGHDLENVDPRIAREQLNRSTPPKPEPHQPRQASTTVRQGKTLAEALFPLNPEFLHLLHKKPAPSTNSIPPPQFNHPSEATHTPRQVSAASRSQHPRAALAEPKKSAHRTQQPDLTPANGASVRQDPVPNHLPEHESVQDTANMASSGAYIPPNQQRNMRACMVCSIVRTQQQFMSSGCPNCEDILELAGNPEQINDCTSQVFEGLISVADTKRSWVARYQRLEGYVPGVYATQVEGILPEDIIGAVESAGINYVPRDGSEQEMLPKD